MKHFVKGFICAAVIVLAVAGLTACSGGGVDQQTAQQVAQTVYDGLTDAQKGQIVSDVSQAEVTAVSFEQESGLVYDATAVGQEVYRVCFPWAEGQPDRGSPDGYIVFVSQEDYHIVGYGMLEAASQTEE